MAKARGIGGDDFLRGFFYLFSKAVIGAIELKKIFF
jgi:hypothetical protein